MTLLLPLSLPSIPPLLHIKPGISSHSGTSLVSLHSIPGLFYLLAHHQHWVGLLHRLISVTWVSLWIWMFSTPYPSFTIHNFNRSQNEFKNLIFQICFNTSNLPLVSRIIPLAVQIWGIKGALLQDSDVLVIFCCYNKIPWSEYFMKKGSLFGSQFRMVKVHTQVSLPIWPLVRALWQMASQLWTHRYRKDQLVRQEARKEFRSQAFSFIITLARTNSFQEPISNPSWGQCS